MNAAAWGPGALGPGTAVAEATTPPEARGLARDEVRLLVSTPAGHEHRRFRDLPDLLQPGDLLVVNDSATLPASLPATTAGRPFRLNLSTRYGERLWLAEPRRSHAEPGPLSLRPGDRATLGADAPVAVTFVAPHPGLPRLWFVASDAPLESAIEANGEPIRYRHVAAPQPLEAYQSVFSRVPGSAEMPSAARPFTNRLLDALSARGVRIAAITLHAGVSSLDLEDDPTAATLFAEPFEVPEATAAAVESARRAGNAVVAVGTTVVRALETAFDGRRLRATRGFTRRFVRPGTFRGSVDGLLTGFHEAASTHLAMLAAIAGADAVRASYRLAAAEGYLWHEFGDSHLLLPAGAPGRPAAAGLAQ